MNGAFLNALGILLGALAGLIRRTPLAPRAQFFLRTVLGVATIFAGIRLVEESLGVGFGTGMKRLLIALVAVVLGFWLGKLMRLQKLSNFLGRQAGRLIANARQNPPGRPVAGLTACVLLFGAAPLGWLGAAEDGFTGQCYLLAVKALMDALAMLGFVAIFGWPAALSAFPIFCLLGAVTWGVQKMAAPFCMAHHVADSVTAATGVVACAVSLVIFEVRKVELANFLPAMAVAPVLEWLWR